MGESQSRQPVATPAAHTLEAELDRIAALSLDEVRALWREMTQQNAPKALSRDLLARMIAYRVQEQRLGKLGRETRKLLDRLAKGGAEPVRQVAAEDGSDLLGLFFDDDELLGDAPVAERHGSTDPEALPFGGGDLVTDTLADHLSFELGE
jgi:Protein of unknown function (DUF2924)